MEDEEKREDNGFNFDDIDEQALEEIDFGGTNGPLAPDAAAQQLHGDEDVAGAYAESGDINREEGIGYDEAAQADEGRSAGEDEDEDEEGDEEGDEEEEEEQGSLSKAGEEDAEVIPMLLVRVHANLPKSGN